MSGATKKPRQRANATEASQQSASPVTGAIVTATESVSKSPLVREFEGHRLTVLERDGRPYWIAREVGAAMGYEDGSKLVDQIGDEWADEFIEGTDFTRVSGRALAEVKSVLAQKDCDGMTPRNSGSQRGGAQSLLLLSETGVNLAAIKTRKPAGKRLRRWLASEVLPALARGNALSAATDEQIRTAVRAEMDRQFRTPESKHAELSRLAGQSGEAFAKLVGCDPTQARAWALELAKGLVGYGGSGRELGYVSARQFKAMQALLRSLPTCTALVPKRRRKQIVKVLAAGEGTEAQPLLPFRFAADVGSAVLTVSFEPKETV